MSQESERTCLVVDDEPLIADMVASIVEDCGYRVAVKNSLKEGKRALTESYLCRTPYGLVILDGFLKPLKPAEQNLGSLDGAILARQASSQSLALRRRFPDLELPVSIIVLITASYCTSTPEGKDFLRKRGVLAIHGKPFDIKDVVLMANYTSALQESKINGYISPSILREFSEQTEWNFLIGDKPQEDAVA